MNPARHRRALALASLLFAACGPRDPGGHRAATASAEGVGNDLAPGQRPAPMDAAAQIPRSPQPGALLRPIGVPALVSGSLSAGDTPMEGGRVCNEFIVLLRAGQTVTIEAHSGRSRLAGGTMDMYLYLRLQGSDVASDDDSAGNFDSQIVYTPTVTGPYVIRVTTYSSSNPYGDYTLRTRLGASAPAY